jgi:hypothetical protein
MINLADTTSLLDETTQKLSGESAALTPQEGIILIDRWLTPLKEAENTRPLAEELEKLRVMLQNPDGQSGEVPGVLEKIADSLSILAAQTGPEGEVPYLIEGLAAALRLAAGSSNQ